MFGVLKGRKCGMGSELWNQWIGHVCGVCLSLKDNYGQASRMTMNYDAAFLSVLCEAQNPGPPITRTSRCLLRSSSRMKVTSPSNPGAQFAATMSLVAASTRIEDHVRDGETFLRHIPGLSYKIAEKWKQAAQRTASALEFDTNIIEAQAQRQGNVEARPDQDFAFYARPTELSVAAAFRHTAVLANRPQNADTLFDIGRLFGRIMYLLDSYADYAADLVQGKFNALAACTVKEETQPQAKGIFRKAFHQIELLFNQLDLPQPSLTKGLLIRQLQRAGHKILKINEYPTLSYALPSGSGPAVLGGMAFAGQGLDADSEGPSRRCPHCGWFVDADSTSCIHCGREIEPLSESVTEQDPDKKPRDSSSDDCCDNPCCTTCDCIACFCDIAQCVGEVACCQ